jgi:protease-4
VHVIFLRFLGNLVRLALAPILLFARWRARSQSRWVVLQLQPRLVQFRAREKLWRRLLARAPERRTTALDELGRLTRQIARDPKFPGLLLYVPGLEASWPLCEAVCDVLSELRRAGKQVVCYLPEGGSNRELLIALACDRIYLAPFSSLGPFGVAAGPAYVRPLLDRIGVAVQAQSCGEYKSAAEPALRASMSEPAREQLQALLDSRQHSLRQAFARRGLNDDQVSEVFQSGLLSAQRALDARIVDGLAYEDELAQRLGLPESTTDEPQRRFRSAAAYLQLREARIWRPLRSKPCIAVVPLHGTIMGNGGGGLMRATLQPAALATRLRGLAGDPQVRAVVLYIDSPGGSALASELMHREIMRLAAKKPVVACFGDVAASGGYYLACACQRIVSPPLAITGSIGVISVKLSAADLLAKLGVRPQLLRTAPSADMFSVARALTSEEEAFMRTHADETYARFLDVVAQNRARSVAEVEPLARGRVWSGRDAHAKGLVDVLGGLPRALDEARSLVTDVSASVRAALEPRVFELKGTTQPAGPDLVARLGPWFEAVLPELALCELTRRETTLCYAPLPSDLV